VSPVGEYLTRPWVRLALVGVVLLVIQTTVAPEFTVLGTKIDLLLAASVTGGAVAGPEQGALAGFVFGLLFDLVLITPFGLSPLVYGAAAFLAGFVQTVTIDPVWWLLGAVNAASAAVGTVGFAAAATVVGEPGMIHPRLLVVALVVGLAAAALGPVLAPVLRWCLRVRRPDAVRR
jgi:rod shape-determining protein MreD